MTDRKALKILKRTPKKYGYVVHEEIWHISDGMVMTTCYTNNGDWIGNEKTAKFLCKKKGIAPEHITPMEPYVLQPCSIGFCEKDQKWYGWSHRAIYGFGIGSEVKWGDVNYKPRNEEEFNKKYAEFFFSPEYMSDLEYETSEDEEGNRGVLIKANYTNQVPNTRLRGANYSTFWPYRNEKFGKGEWKAETLEDAREMAADFAESVS